MLDNGVIRAVFDYRNGAMISLQDAAGEEFIAPGKRAGFVLAETEKRTSDAWNIGRYLKEFSVDGAVELVEHTNGPLRKGFTVKTRVLNSVITAEIYLDKGAEQVTVKTEVDWHETAGETVPVLTYMLPAAYIPETFLYNVPGGNAAR